MRKYMSLSILAGLLLGSSMSAHSQRTATAHEDVHLSPQLRGLLQEEMQEIARGTQTLALALATADWKTMHDTSAKIRASYILEKKLTPSQRHELERSLPAGFKQSDAEFHARAQKLAKAAADHDAELAAFHYYRMVESCAACHASYARSRFPGFMPEKPAVHRH